MDEVEVKILDIDRKKVENKLISLGAKKVFDDEMHAVLFDFKGDSLKKSKMTLRIRKEGGVSFFELKEVVPAKHAKIRKEHRIKISDFEEMRYILEFLGLKPWLIMNKHRTSYELNGVHFDFDNYKDEHEFVPEYLEIEAGDEETVYKYAKMLGFKKEDCKDWVFWDVAKYYSK